MPDHDEENLACPACDALFVEDPHAKLSAATVVKLPNNNPPRFQCRCRRCGMRGPKKSERAEAIEQWAKLEQITS